MLIDNMISRSFLYLACASYDVKESIFVDAHLNNLKKQFWKSPKLISGNPKESLRIKNKTVFKKSFTMI